MGADCEGRRAPPPAGAPAGATAPGVRRPSPTGYGAVPQYMRAIADGPAKTQGLADQVLEGAAATMPTCAGGQGPTGQCDAPRPQRKPEGGEPIAEAMPEAVTVSIPRRGPRKMSARLSAWMRSLFTAANLSAGACRLRRPRRPRRVPGVESRPDFRLGDQDARRCCLKCGQAPEVVRVVAPHFDHARAARPSIRGCAPGGPVPPPRGRPLLGACQVLARGEEVLDLVEDPGVSNAASADHDAWPLPLPLFLGG